MANESQFPTIRDLRDCLTELVELGVGELPTQVTIVPSSTMIVVARAINPKQFHGKAPLMIEFGSQHGRIGAVPVSCDYLGNTSMPLLS